MFGFSGACRQDTQSEATLAPQHGPTPTTTSKRTSKKRASDRSRRKRTSMEPTQRRINTTITVHNVELIELEITFYTQKNLEDCT
jgi:hypothetical protein